MERFPLSRILHLLAICLFVCAQFGFSADYQVIDLGSIGYNKITACAINDANQILGVISDQQYVCASGSNAPVFFWERGVLTLLPFSGIGRHSLNNLGQVVGQATNCSGGICSPQGVIWRKGTLTPLGNILPVAINEDAR